MLSFNNSSVNDTPLYILAPPGLEGINAISVLRFIVNSSSLLTFCLLYLC